MLKIVVSNGNFQKIEKMLRLELCNVWEVKLGVLNDSELIGTMYLSL